MITDLKPYPEYRQTELPWCTHVPSHWGLVPNRGLIRRRKVLVGDRHTEYRLLSLTKQGVIVRDISTGKGKFSSDMGTSQVVRDGDLVFCLFDVPETPRTVGLSRHKGMITGAYTVFESLGNGNPEYFEFFYRAMDDRKLLSPLYSGLRNIIPAARFLGTKSPLPPLEEQEAIVRFLAWVNGRLERAIRAKQKQLTLATERVQVETEQTLRLVESPKERLSTIARVMSRPVNRLGDEHYTRIGLYNRGRGIFHKPSTLGTELGESEFFYVLPGDLVISGQFAWEGAVAFARAKDRGCIASHRYPILRGKEGIVSSAFLFSFFRSSYGAMLLDHHSRGAAGRNRPLNEKRLLKEKIPVPPLALQRRIEFLLEQEFLVAQSVARETVLLREYQTRLVADVITGRLDVREAAAKLPKEISNEITFGEDFGDDAEFLDQEVSE